MAIKIWAWILIAFVIVEGIVFFYMNYSIYAGVLNTASFLVLISVPLLGAFYMMFGRERKMTLIISGGFILLFLILLLTAIPTYTYKDAQQLVKKHSEGQLESYSLEHKTIPLKKNPGWFLNNRAYYISVKSNNDKQSVQYFFVNPVEGEPVKMDEPYW